MMMDVKPVKKQKLAMNRIALLMTFLFALGLVASTMFVVDQRQSAVMVSGLGNFKRVISAPGLYWKWPAPFNRVMLLDKRTQIASSSKPESYLTADRQEVFVSLYIKWRITDPTSYFNRFRHELAPAQNQLLGLAYTALEAKRGQYSAAELAANSNHQIISVLQTQTAHAAREWGIEIADIRITHLGFTAESNDEVYKQMGAERAEVAQQLRSAGLIEAAQVRSYAERERETILAQGYKRAQMIKGDGDAQAVAIYASAFGRDPQFYRFYKSLDAYRQIFRERDLIVVDPTSDFFRFMHNPAGMPSRKP
ncbi:protease modulator HflC [Mycoavidus sp. B2-EB]|uniref:protease modulator HflC n=1 Tax=Mycoavidus sp. B2-EB TaxID=2651972 RepID=UPI001E2FB77D|nr:protease modulator HflC [Mycoavidus sp. B2-EB]BBO59464.1 protein HflC [Mycoavidus sp. B2-EB]